MMSVNSTLRPCARPPSLNRSPGVLRRRCRAAAGRSRRSPEPRTAAAHTRGQVDGEASLAGVVGGADRGGVAEPGLGVGDVVITVAQQMSQADRQFGVAHQHHVRVRGAVQVHPHAHSDRLRPRARILQQSRQSTRARRSTLQVEIVQASVVAESLRPTTECAKLTSRQLPTWEPPRSRMEG
jgi:hypothetical protein